MHVISTSKYDNMHPFTVLPVYAPPEKLEGILSDDINVTITFLNVFNPTQLLCLLFPGQSSCRAVPIIASL